MIIIIKATIIFVLCLFILTTSKRRQIEQPKKILIIRPSQLFIFGVYSGAILSIIVIETIIWLNNISISEDIIGLFLVGLTIFIVLYNIIKFSTLKLYINEDRMIIETIFSRHEYMFCDFISDELGHMTEEKDKVFYYLLFKRCNDEVKVNIDYISNKDRLILSELITKRTGKNVILHNSKYESRILTIINILLVYVLSFVGLFIIN